jgi:hypothetical protein
MEPTQCSETSAFNTQTPGKYPEDNRSLQQHGESLKTRTSGYVLCEVGTEFLLVIHMNVSVQTLTVKNLRYSGKLRIVEW